jgi:hypothetical protein
MDHPRVSINIKNSIQQISLMSQPCPVSITNLASFQQKSTSNDALVREQRPRSLSMPSINKRAHSLATSLEDTRNPNIVPQEIVFKNSFAPASTTNRSGSKTLISQAPSGNIKRQTSFISIEPLEQPLAQSQPLATQFQQDIEFYIPRYSQSRLKILHKKSISVLTYDCEHQTPPLNIKNRELALQSPTQLNHSTSAANLSSTMSRPPLSRATNSEPKQTGNIGRRHPSGSNLAPMEAIPQGHQLSQNGRRNSSNVSRNNSLEKQVPKSPLSRSQSLGSNTMRKMAPIPLSLSPGPASPKSCPNQGQLTGKRPKHTRHLSIESQQSVQLRRNSSFTIQSDQHSNASGSFYVQEMRRRKAATWCDIPASVWGIPIGIANEYATNHSNLKSENNDEASNKGKVSRRRSIISRSPSFSHLRRKSLLLSKSPVEEVQKRTIDIRHSHLRPRLLSTEIKDELFGDDPYQQPVRKMSDAGMSGFEFDDLQRSRLLTYKDKEVGLAMFSNTKEVAHLDCSNVSTDRRSFSSSSISSSASSKFSSYTSSQISSPGSSTSSTPSALDKMYFIDSNYRKKLSSPSPSSKTLSQISLGTLNEELVSQNIKLFIANPDIPVVEPASG